jgi:competence protein ComEA
MALGAASILASVEARGQAAPSPAAAAQDALPPGPGHDTTLRVCSACHAPGIVTKQRLSREGWHELVETMAGRGAQGSDQDFAQITDYLAKNFPDQPAK